MRRLGLLAMSLLYIGAGIAHFALSRMYEQAMPQMLPSQHALVLISGAAEIAGGIGLLVPATRRAAAWGIVALLIAVFPANISMALRPQDFPAIPAWMLWARLPLQLPLIGWAWMYTRKADDSNTSAAF